MADPLRLLSLCSGVGMLDEGAHAALDHLGVGCRAVGYVERDAYAAAALLARMEDSSLEPAPVWAGNLEDVRWESWRGAVDIVTAGFPCQPWSAAGKQRGTDDERWIWPAIVDVIRAVEPRLVFLENVRGLVSGGGLDPVLGALADLGFNAEWGVLSAGAVGASHKRERIFILAFRPGRGLGILRQSSGGGGFVERGDCSVADAQHRAVSHAGRGQIRRAGAGQPGCALLDDALSLESGRERVHAGPRQAGSGAGDAGGAGGDGGLDHPDGGRCEQCGPGDGGAEVAGSGCLDVAHPGRAGCEGRGHAWEERRCEPWPCGQDGAVLPFFAPGPADPRWLDILAGHPEAAPAVEPGFRLLADGLALVVDESRPDQLRCGGNGVVAAQAATAFVLLARRVISGP